MDISGKSAVVTGGGNGIGRAISLALARKGANVAVADIEAGAAEMVALEVTELGVEGLAVKTDVTREEDLTNLADEAWAAFGSVELLFNNAGVVAGTKPILETTKQEVDWTIAVNLGGVLNAVQVFAPRFIASGSPAWIVNTGSEHSLGAPHTMVGIYTGTKHAVLGVSDILRRELPDHVGVSVLCPGIVETTMWRATERRQPEFGGAEDGDQGNKAAMKFGMAADAVAERVVTGVERETFYIMTHAHVVDVARKRWKEIEEAFATQTPRYDGDDQYETNNILGKLTDNQGPQ